jgi:hypothetical protein
MNRFRPILSATFAIMVLFSSSSFMVGIHLCKGHVQNIALLNKADACGMEKQMPPCHHESKPCCEDESIIHQGSDFQVSSTDISLSPMPAVDIELVPIVLSEVIPSTPVSRTHFHNYDPPFQAADRIVSFQVFLI